MSAGFVACGRRPIAFGAGHASTRAARCAVARSTPIGQASANRRTGPFVRTGFYSGQKKSRLNEAAFFRGAQVLRRWGTSRPPEIRGRISREDRGRSGAANAAPIPGRGAARPDFGRLRDANLPMLSSPRFD